MNDKTSQPIELKIVCPVGPWWCMDEEENLYRDWQNLPPRPLNRDGTEQSDAAAQVRLKVRWPFKQWQWMVYSPWSNKAVLHGKEWTIEAAKEKADLALRELCRRAGGQVGDACQ